MEREVGTRRRCVNRMGIMLGHEAVWGPPHVRRAAPGQPGRTDRVTRSPVELIFRMFY
jgi:hypothetical protein